MSALLHGVGLGDIGALYAGADLIIEGRRLRKLGDPSAKSEDFYQGWAAFLTGEPFKETQSSDWRIGFTESRDAYLDANPPGRRRRRA